MIALPNITLIVVFLVLVALYIWRRIVIMLCDRRYDLMSQSYQDGLRAFASRVQSAIDDDQAHSVELGETLQRIQQLTAPYIVPDEIENLINQTKYRPPDPGRGSL